MAFQLFSKNKLRQEEEKCVNEKTSPLLRIMSVFDDSDIPRRSFFNNICAFHIGNGYILSVAHNLRTECGLLKSMPETEYQSMMALIPEQQRALFNNSYVVDRQTSKRYLNTNLDATLIQQMQVILNQSRYDTRWVSLYEHEVCRPFLIAQFRDNLFYSDEEATSLISENHRFHEPSLGRYTFLIEVELVEAFYSSDYALYKIVGNEDLISKIPFFELDFRMLGSNDKLNCLQSAPVDNLGRLFNDADIEGILDHWNNFPDRIQGNYLMDGLRYLVKGYFRFGSSGAPYLIFDSRTRKFKVNAIQSEASGIQLMINGNRNNSYQYINAIASPIKNIETELKRILGV